MIRIVLLGGGGHASDVLGAIEARIASDPDFQCEVLGILADEEVDERRFAHRGVRHIGGFDRLKTIDAGHYIACVGYPLGRKAVAAIADGSGMTPLSVVHPRAWVPEGTVIGSGSVILAGACVSPGVVIGQHVYLSHGSLIGHDCNVHDFVSVMPGGSVSGDARLEESCMIGANATVLQGITVGAGATLGAGAVAVSDIPPGAIAKGIPARWQSTESGGPL